MLWQLVLALVAAWLVLDAWRRRRVLALAAQLPAVDGTAIPLLGHTYMFLGSDEDRMNTLMAFGRDAIKHGGIAKIWFGRQMWLVCSDAACAEVALKNCLDKYDNMNYIKDVTGNGLVFADVNIWRPRRKVMAPVFGPKTLNKFVEVFHRQSQVLVRQLEKNIGGGAFSVWKYITTYTMDAVCETNLGVQISAQLNPEHVFLEAFDRGSQLVAARVCQPWLQFELVYPWTSHYAELEESKRIMYTFVEDIIKTKRKEITAKNQQVDYGFETIEKHDSYKTFLDMLIENSGGAGGYTDLELREETLVIAMAGTDTSAVGACFALCMLARFPHVQKKIHQELKEVFGTSDRPLTHEDLPRLKYTEAVVKESIRLHPPVPVIIRKVENEVSLPTGHTLVPGIGVLINIYGIHRNPRYWGADADHFRPERFLEPLSHPAAFVPFSHGPRNCIGYQYAMMSMKTAVASIVRAYRVLPPAGAATGDRMFRLKFEIMMKDVDGFQMRLEKR